MGTAQDVLIAYCGLCCSNCGSYRKARCQGCHSDTAMFKNCPVKACASGHGYTTCADCADFGDLKECKKLYNFISRAFGFVFQTDRIGKLNHIRQVGLEKFKEEKMLDARK